MLLVNWQYTNLLDLVLVAIFFNFLYEKEIVKKIISISKSRLSNKLNFFIFLGMLLGVKLSEI